MQCGGRTVDGVCDVEACEKFSCIRNAAVDCQGGLARIAGGAHPAAACTDDAARIAQRRSLDAPDDVACFKSIVRFKLHFAEMTLAYLQVVDHERDVGQVGCGRGRLTSGARHKGFCLVFGKSESGEVDFEARMRILCRLVVLDLSGGVVSCHSHVPVIFGKSARSHVEVSKFFAGPERGADFCIDERNAVNG